MGLFDFFKKNNSKDEAKSRLKLVLMQDRAMLPSGVMERIKDDIIQVLSKYVEIDQEQLNIEMSNCVDDPRQIALLANIPIRQKNK